MTTENKKIMMIYNDIAMLDRNVHKTLRLTPTATFKYAENINLVPVAISEFGQLSRTYPIIFIEDKKENVVAPAALLGLSFEKNDFVDKDGKWRDSSYIPAFIRRYPFMLAETDKSDEFTICIDEQASHFVGNGEESFALFTEEGKNTPFLDEMINFLHVFRQDMEQTKEFVKELKRLDLLVTRSVQIKDNVDVLFQINDMLVVDEEKFRNLRGVELEKLAKSGFLNLIFMHLFSLGNISENYKLRADEK